MNENSSMMNIPRVTKSGGVMAVRLRSNMRVTISTDTSRRRQDIMTCPSSAQCLFFLPLTSQVVPVRARRAGIPFDFRHSSRREFRGPCVDTLGRCGVLMGIKSANTRISNARKLRCIDARPVCTSSSLGFPAGRKASTLLPRIG
jgi:hypothetical protein